MLSERDNQFLKEINTLKELIDAKMLNQLKTIKDGKEVESFCDRMTVEDYTEKMDRINSIINAVKDDDYSLLRSELPAFEKFISEIKFVFSGFKQTMEELERRMYPENEKVALPKFKTNLRYKEKVEGNLEGLLRKMESELEKYKEVEPEINLEEIKTKDLKYRKCVQHVSTLDLVLSSLVTNDPSYLVGSVFDNIGELIIYVRKNYFEYLEDILWVYNIFMSIQDVQAIIDKYLLPFTIESLGEDIYKPYQEVVKCFEKCIAEYSKTDTPTELLKERINDLRIVLHYIDFALS